MDGYSGPTEVPVRVRCETSGPGSDVRSSSFPPASGFRPFSSEANICGGDARHELAVGDP